MRLGYVDDGDCCFNAEDDAINIDIESEIKQVLREEPLVVATYVSV